MNSDSQSTKAFKLCFNNEIHRISKPPTDYKTLVQSVVAAFKANLPASWALQYKDADGDFIMLTSDEDYRAMIEGEEESQEKSIKIYLLPLEKPSRDFNSELDISKASSVDYSQILPVQQNESVVKNESSEIIAQPEEKPAVEEQIPEPVPEVKEEVQEVKEVVPEPQEEVKESVADQSTNVEESHMEPKILAQNISNTSAYVDAAFDYVNNQPEIKEEVSEEKPQAEGEEKPCRFRKGCRRSSVSRKDRIRPAVTEILFENIPVLAELMSEYLKDPSAFNLAELTKKVQVQQEKAQPAPLPNEAVHRRVACDGCGVCPILGVRYKCSVCEDFDYCEKCEATIEHPHPFLKIRDPKHNPKAIITILEEDLPKQDELSLSAMGKALGQKVSSLGKETIEQVNKLAEKLFGASESQEEEQLIKKVEELSVPEEKVEEIVREVELVKEAEPVQEVVEKKAEEPVVEKKVEEPVLNVAFVREICTIPAKITVNEKSIYKTIVIKNSGRTEWPSSTKIVNVSGAAGQDVKLLPLASGKEFSCILVIECPNQPADYISEWRLVYTDEKNEVQNIGESFFVSFAVIKPEIVIANIPLVESQIIKKEVPVPKPVVQKKIYSADVQKKAQTIKEIFPEANIEDLYEFISKTPKLSVEELLETYMA